MSLNFSDLEKRKEPIKQVKYKTIIEGSNVTKSVKKVDYEYFLCDRCTKEFKSNNKKWQEKEGGILEYPINQFERLKLVLCNECLKNAIKECDKHYKKI